MCYLRPLGFTCEFRGSLSEIVSRVLIGNIFFVVVYRIWKTCSGRQWNEAFSGKVAS